MDYKIFSELISQSLEKFQSISEEDWNFKPSVEKWSKKEILGHLCDSAINNIRRMVITQYQENVNIVYDQDFWVKAQNYQSRPYKDIIHLWKSLNEQVVILVENIPDEKLKNICDTTKNETSFVSLEFIINDYVEHAKYHLAKIFLNVHN